LAEQQQPQQGSQQQLQRLCVQLREPRWMPSWLRSTWLQALLQGVQTGQ
jgi:hypothetical protein